MEKCKLICGKVVVCPREGFKSSVVQTADCAYVDCYCRSTAEHKHYPL